MLPKSSTWSSSLFKLRSNDSRGDIADIWLLVVIFIGLSKSSGNIPFGARVAGVSENLVCQATLHQHTGAVFVHSEEGSEIGNTCSLLHVVSDYNDRILFD